VRLGRVQLVEQLEVALITYRSARRAVHLLTTTIGLSPSASAFFVTKRVCGIGPSTASTQQHAVDHRQHPFDLAAEVGVPRVSTM